MCLQVAVARMRSTQQVYALKIMNKWDMLKRGEVTSFDSFMILLYDEILSWIESLSLHI